MLTIYQARTSGLASDCLDETEARPRQSRFQKPELAAPVTALALSLLLTVGSEFANDDLP